MQRSFHRVWVGVGVAVLLVGVGASGTAVEVGLLEGVGVPVGVDVSVVGAVGLGVALPWPMLGRGSEVDGSTGTSWADGPPAAGAASARTELGAGVAAAEGTALGATGVLASSRLMRVTLLASPDAVALGAVVAAVGSQIWPAEPPIESLACNSDVEPAIEAPPRAPSPGQ